jgi:D-serine dehydratase
VETPSDQTKSLAKLQAREPLLWINPRNGVPLPATAPPSSQIREAEARLARCQPLLIELFPELAGSAGEIESELMPAGRLRDALTGPDLPWHGAWFLKRDDSPRRRLYQGAGRLS